MTDTVGSHLSNTTIPPDATFTISTSTVNQTRGKLTVTAQAIVTNNCSQLSWSVIILFDRKPKVLHY